MALPSDPGASIGLRTQQIVLFVREIKLISTQIVDFIDGANGKQLTGGLVIDKLNSLVSIKSMLSSFIDADTRARLLVEFPSNFANAADVSDQIGTANANLVGLINELHSLAQVVAGAGQLVSTDPDNGTVHSVITGPESDALRAFAAGVIASID